MPIKPYVTEPTSYTTPYLELGTLLRVTKDLGYTTKVGDYLVVTDTTQAVNITRGTHLYLDCVLTGNMRVVEVTLQEVQ